jgi:hypothetical protein
LNDNVIDTERREKGRGEIRLGWIGGGRRDLDLNLEVEDDV